MRKKNIENFELRVGDIAIARVSRNKVPHIEVAYIENPDIRAIFTYDTCQFVSGNILKQDIQYVTEKIKRNKRFLGGM